LPPAWPPTRQRLSPRRTPALVLDHHVPEVLHGPKPSTRRDAHRQQNGGTSLRMHEHLNPWCVPWSAFEPEDVARDRCAAPQATPVLSPHRQRVVAQYDPRRGRGARARESAVFAPRGSAAEFRSVRSPWASNVYWRLARQIGREHSSGFYPTSGGTRINASFDFRRVKSRRSTTAGAKRSTTVPKQSKNGSLTFWSNTRG
jgi:hypothetical protein